MSKDWNGNKNSVWKTLGASNNMDKKEEELAKLGFKGVIGYENRLLINKNGNIYSLKTHKFLKTSITPNGYEALVLMLQTPKRHSKTLYVHRLVATTFIPNPYNKKTVNHIDGNKLNNNINNLEWATQSENNIHAIRKLNKKVNTSKIVEINIQRRMLTKEQAYFIKTHKELSVKELCNILKITCKDVVRDCRDGKTYKDID